MKSNNNKIPLLVVIIVSTIMIFSVYEYSMSVFSEKNKIIKDESNPKLEFESMQNCNCVAFRLDDIQGYWLNKVQIAIIETFQKENTSLTIGIIGGEKFHFDEDSKILNFINNGLSDDPSFIEIANHGWNHEDFSTFDKEIQSELINKTNQRIYNLLDNSPKVFIPPYNKFDNNTLIALQENNITHFSSMLETSNPPYRLEGVTLFHFPATATTGKIDPNLGIFKKISNQETIDAVKDSLNKYGFAVVTMHPQEFSVHENNIKYTNNVDWEKIEELETLLDKIQKLNLKIVFLSQINKNISSQDIDSISDIKVGRQIDSFLGYLVLGIIIILFIILLIRIRNKMRLQNLTNWKSEKEVNR